MHLMSGRRHSRLSERLARARVFPGDARPRQAGDHGLRRRRSLQTPRRASQGGGTGATGPTCVGARYEIMRNEETLLTGSPEEPHMRRRDIVIGLAASGLAPMSV